MCWSVYIALRQIQKEIPIGFCTHFIGLGFFNGHCQCEYRNNLLLLLSSLIFQGDELKSASVPTGDSRNGRW